MLSSRPTVWAMLLGLTACTDPGASTGPEPLTFEQYRDRYASPGPNGTWYVEEDIWLRDEAALRKHYLRYYVDPSECPEGQVCQAATVMHDNGRDTVWNVADKLALSYCIADMGGATNTARIRDALDQATREWEFAADVNFVHVASQDGSNCRPGKNGVMFRVRRGIDPDDCSFLGCPTARAFFPDEPAATREMLFFDDAFPLTDGELLGVARHELGHVLGLRHEHIRFDQKDPGCALEGALSPNWRATTSPDSKSIMGYYQCDGIAGSSFDRPISERDALGLRYLYNIPRGHGRANGAAFNQPNSFLGNGAGDDVLWFRPDADTYTLWDSRRTGFEIEFDIYEQCPRVGQGRGDDDNGFSIAALAGGNGICRERKDEVGPDRRPFSVQWWFQGGDANLNREVFYYGPGTTLEDGLLVNLNNGAFDRYPATVNGFYYPLIGTFHQSGILQSNRTEIVWYKPGSSSDFLWKVDDNVLGHSWVVDPHSAYHPHDGYWDAVVGTFGDHNQGGDEILWYGGGDCYGEVWRGDGATGWKTDVVDILYMTGTCGGMDAKPLLGNFNGDANADILWYRPGPGKDRILFAYDRLYLGAIGFKDIVVNGLYRPLVGDFNGDFTSDVLWYNAGPGVDPLWLFVKNGGGEYSSSTLQIQGDYAPIVGHFNKDGCADILWFDAVKNLVIPWASNCNGTFTTQPTIPVPDGVYPVGWGIGR